MAALYDLNTGKDDRFIYCDDLPEELSTEKQATRREKLMECVLHAESRQGAR